MGTGARAEGFVRVQPGRVSRLAPLLSPLPRLLLPGLVPGLVLLACAGAPRGVPEWHDARSLGGRTLRITVRHGDETLAHAAVEGALAAAESTWSTLRPAGAGSEVDLLCRVPSHLWVQVSRTTFEALALGASVAEATGGAYDYTWRALEKPWGLRPGDTPRVPRDFEVDIALRRVGWENVEIRDDDGPEARRLTRRTVVDLGALATGIALDAAIERLRALGMPAGHADAGDLHAVFGGSDDRPWTVRPSDEGARDAPRALTLTDGAVALSSRGNPVLAVDGTSVYRRLDPRDGRPVDQRWALVLATRAGDAAAWADALLALGAEGAALVEARPELEAAVGSGEGAVWSSSGMAARRASPR